MARKANAWAHFFPEGKGIPKPGYVLHHKDPSLRHTDITRYEQWNPDDLVMMTRAEHTKLHQTDKKFARRSGASPLEGGRTVKCFVVHPAVLAAAEDFSSSRGLSVSVLVRHTMEKLAKMASASDWTQLRSTLQDLDKDYEAMRSRERKGSWYMMLSDEEIWKLKCIQIAGGAHFDNFNYSASHLVELCLVASMNEQELFK